MVVRSLLRNVETESNHSVSAFCARACFVLGRHVEVLCAK